ncbi:radical SAM protein [Actinacidiphila paucisporea]|uniref:Radical SAM superfamily enzyme, MoaA/NifB/PqqE/SkfB family n=1 Tax=Actinacidiphila paucisporea TaxID=310782 RepID=A0A1M7PH78_9ACTN|nr:radical SAM protein [Actinacidiphila paucisporea]SHN16485.1 Radical SAM superfamily enzyme, MoaA/NifB/PqqE/SkfB family [Actinacidiphila paucisporea]
MRALPLRPTFVWLEITGFCNLNCRHCYANSSPQGTHGDMTGADWLRVIDELNGMGVRDVQFIGGEPTLHPGLPGFVRRARRHDMRVEVFSNMTHLRPEVWEVLRLPGVRLAFSYYSDDAGDHDEVTDARGAHARTRTNVERGRALGIEMRGSVIDVIHGQRARGAEQELLQLGIRDVRTDRIRPFGRGAGGAYPDVSGLCGMCGRAKFAISPDGYVWPCVFARWMNLGNVHEQSLQAIYGGVAMRAARAELEAVFPASAVRAGPTCLPDCNPAFETCGPQTVCAPDASCGPTADSSRPAPSRSVRYYNPGVSGTGC